MTKLLAAAVAALLMTGCAHAGPAPLRFDLPDAPPEDAVVFEARDGQTTDAVHGSFFVPENRAEPNARALELHYVRFPSTSDNPGAPIVYLAGGPGGSGIETAKGRRFPLFMALREVADVIAFDQRGTGASNDIESCELPGPPRNAPYTHEVVTRAYRDAWAFCAEQWRAQGVDIRGYTTVENAADLDALREHLGAEKISLWGISYGTHLAFAALKQMDDRIDRVVLASAEGPDQTVKLPSRTDAYVDRVQAAIDTQPDAAHAYPDIKGMLRRIIDRLAAQPATVTLAQEDGSEFALTFGAYDVQLLISFAIADPNAWPNALPVFAAADGGNYDPLGGLLLRFLHDDDMIRLGAMSTAMDYASGISAARLAQVREQATTSLLADALNAPMPHLVGAEPVLDLGDAFRADTVTDRPALLLTGALDGRTYPEAQIEATAGFSNLTHVVIQNAGHNLFMVSPEVTDVVLAFMNGESIEITTITVEPPSFAP